jgi:uroporphyrinogen-III synthase
MSCDRRGAAIDPHGARIHGRAMAAVQRSLSGLTVLAFESRRADEIAELIRRFGGTPLSAPSMQEIPLDASPEAEELLRRLHSGAVDVLVLLTGVGTRALVSVLEHECPRDRLLALLAQPMLVARGPKPVAALRELGLTPAVVVPEPNTWRELLVALDAAGPVAGRCIAVQEYGRTNPELLAALAARGADVLPVPVYRWTLPDDQAALQQGIRQLAGGAVDVALFTSARQVVHVMESADQLGARAAVADAARRTVFASIGPICSEALRAHALPVDIEPVHPKMGPLVAAVAQHARPLLEAKRSGA